MCHQVENVFDRYSLSDHDFGVKRDSLEESVILHSFASALRVFVGKALRFSGGTTQSEVSISVRSSTPAISDNIPVYVLSLDWRSANSARNFDR